MSPPHVAIVSPNGHLGKHLVPVYAKHVEEGIFASLRLVTTKATPELEQVVSKNSKVEISVVDYSDVKTVEKAFSGVNAVVSALGASGDHSVTEQAIISAAVASGVKVYLPSEWGFAYDDFLAEGGALFKKKDDHRKAAAKAGLKVVAIATGAFGGFVFTPFLGLQGNEWSIPGDGKIPLAVTAETDVAQYSARAVILALESPEKVPERLYIYTGINTFDGWADFVSEKKGTEIKKSYRSREELKKTLESGTSPFGPAFIIIYLASFPASDFSAGSKYAAHNELLNPGQKYFKLTPLETFLQ